MHILILQFRVRANLPNLTLILPGTIVSFHQGSLFPQVIKLKEPIYLLPIANTFSWFII